jgi:hypothetical protein
VKKHCPSNLIIYCILIISFFLFENSTTQKPEVKKDIFLEAESYLLFEEYNDALPLYLKLYKDNPNNANLKYRIGECYLNMPNDKSKSIVFLEEAVKDINPKYKEGNYKETKAPLDAYYYLGNAYRINNQLDKAISCYKKFKKELDPNIYDAELVDDQITACERAYEFNKKPTYFLETNLGNHINSRFSELNPVVSADESTIIYTSELQFYDAIFMSKKVNGVWSYPVNLIPELGVDEKCYPTCLSCDGTELYLYKSDDYLGDLYVSFYENGQWSKIQKLNDNINTKYWESHACISRDKQTLYFTSNRKGGFGGLDIYKSKRMGKTQWGPAINLGPMINTKYNEDTPFLTEDESTLYFSSYGHDNVGGYDIFYSKNENGNWSEPINLGMPINTTDDDLFFNPVKNGIYAYYSKFSGSGYGKRDIYRLEIFSDQHPRRLKVNGSLALNTNLPLNWKDVQINLLSKNRKDTLLSIHPNDSGKFSFETVPGKYTIEYKGDLIKPKEEKLLIPNDLKENEINLNTYLSAYSKKTKLDTLKKSEIVKIDLKDTLLRVTNGNKLKIRLPLPEGSHLTVISYLDSILIKTENITVQGKRFNYFFTPLEGKNILHFRAVGPDNRIYSGQMVINRIPSNKAKEIRTSQENISGLLKDLAKVSDRNLKAFLININPDKENIYSHEDLTQYLLKNTSKGNYSEADIQNMIISLGSHIASLDFYYLLRNAASGNLKLALINIPDSLRQLSPQELMLYLSKNQKQYGYTDADIIAALKKIISGLYVNPEECRKSLLLVSHGNLNLYLKTLDLKKEKINTTGELIDFLLTHCKQGGYSQQELIEALTALIEYNQTETYRKKLMDISKGNLNKTLYELNLSLTPIRNFGELIEYLYKEGPRKGYTSSDVTNAIIALLSQQQEDTAGFLEKMKNNSSGKLSDLLNDIDLNKTKIANINDLIAYMLKKAPEYKLNEDDILNLLIAMAYHGNLNNYMPYLRSISTGPINSTLLETDIKALKLSNLNDLVNHLAKSAAKQKYTTDDIVQLMQKLYSKRLMDHFDQSIISLSQGNLHSNLLQMSTDIRQLDNYQSQIAYLNAQSVKRGYSYSDVLRLLSEIAEKKQLQHYIDTTSLTAKGNIVTLLLNTDVENEGLANIPNLTSYLMDNAQKMGFNRHDIADALLSKYQHDNSNDLFNKIKIFAGSKYARLFDISSIERQKMIESRNIGTLLLKKGQQNGFNEEIVLNLLARYCASREFAAFLSEFTNIAEGNLKRYLAKNTFNNCTDIPTFIHELEKQSAQNHYKTEDIQKALIGYLNLLDLYNLINGAHQMHDMNQTGNDLQSIPLRSLQTKEPASFIAYLMNLNKKNQFLSADLMSLLPNVITYEDLKAFHMTLLHLSTGGLRNALRKLNLVREKVKKPEDIINYLLQHQREDSYTKEDIIKLLIAAAQKEQELQKGIAIEKKIPENNIVIYSLLFLLLLLLFSAYYFQRRNRRK